ncbi:hypothetical protein EMCRGX_G030729 [Ephydatia muelleri]
MLILPEWVRHCYAVGKSVNTRQGSIQLPLTKIPVDHFIIDELHVLCRIFDVMVDNLVALAVLMDKQARDGSQHHINGLAVAIRECGVTFHMWKDLEKDGKYKCTSLTGGGRKKVIKAKRWINSFLSIPAEGYQKARVTPYMHCLAYHIPDQIRRYGNLRMFSGQGVEKHNDDAKRAYFSSNKWDAAAEIIKTEARVQCLRQFAAAKRPYQKHDSVYWEEGGIQKNRASRKRGAPA